MMRSMSALRFALVMVLALTLGCSSNNKGKIEGTKWQSELGVVKNNQIPAGFIALEFTADGNLVYAAGPDVYRGTYSFGMGNYVTFKLDRELAGRKVHAQKIEVEEGKLKLIDSDGTTLTFVPNKMQNDKKK